MLALNRSSSLKDSALKASTSSTASCTLSSFPVMVISPLSHLMCAPLCMGARYAGNAQHPNIPGSGGSECATRWAQ